MNISKTNCRERIGRYVTLLRRGRVYQADVYFNGVQQRRSLNTRNRKEAEKKALDLDAELRRGEVPERPKRVALADAIAQYIEHVEGHSRRPRTLTQYRHDLGAFLSFASGKGVRYLDQVSLLLVEQHQVAQRKAGYAGKTVQHQMVIIKQMIKWAVERDLLPRNPLVGLKVNQAEAELQPCFGADQVEMVIAASAEPLRSIVEVLAFTGMRIGELVWLTWDDVDLDRGFIHIRPKDAWVPKHGRSRVIPVHARVRAVLETLPRRHRWVFAAAPSRKYPSGGHQISATHTLEKLKAVLRRLGIRGHLHTFRHFFISHCANSGIPPFQLMKWVGHADVKTVMHYYDLKDEESLWSMRRLSQLDEQNWGAGRHGATAGGPFLAQF